jgi:hypothetical protein
MDTLPRELFGGKAKFEFHTGRCARFFLNFLVFGDVYSVVVSW